MEVAAVRAVYGSHEHLTIHPEARWDQEALLQL